MADGLVPWWVRQVLLFGREGQHEGFSGRGASGAGQLTYVSPPVKQDYETLLHPSGLLLKITLHCQYGRPAIGAGGGCREAWSSSS